MVPGLHYVRHERSQACDPAEWTLPQSVTVHSEPEDFLSFYPQRRRETEGTIFCFIVNIVGATRVVCMLPQMAKEIPLIFLKGRP